MYLIQWKTNLFWYLFLQRVFIQKHIFIKYQGCNQIPSSPELAMDHFKGSDPSFRNQAYSADSKGHNSTENEIQND